MKKDHDRPVSLKGRRPDVQAETVLAPLAWIPWDRSERAWRRLRSHWTVGICRSQPTPGLRGNRWSPSQRAKGGCRIRNPKKPDRTVFAAPPRQSPIASLYNEFSVAHSSTVDEEIANTCWRPGTSNLDGCDDEPNSATASMIDSRPAGGTVGGR